MRRRMVPHIFGWFTMSAAWVIMIVIPRTRTRSQRNPATVPTYRVQVHLEWAKLDLAEITDRVIPDWVNAAVRISRTQTTHTLCFYESIDLQ